MKHTYYIYEFTLKQNRQHAIGIIISVIHIQGGEIHESQSIQLPEIFDNTQNNIGIIMPGTYKILAIIITAILASTNYQMNL